MKQLLVVDEKDEKTKQLASFPPTPDISSSDHKKTERWKSSVMEGRASQYSGNDGKNSDMDRQMSSLTAPADEDKNIQATGIPLTAESGDLNGQAQPSGNQPKPSPPRRIVDQLTRRESCESWTLIRIIYWSGVI